MRNLTLALLLVAALGAATASAAHAAFLDPSADKAPASRQQDQPAVIDDNDDTRVEVQLAMLGIAAFTVVGLGGAAYVLRKKLGLVAPPPEQPAGGHH